MKINQFTLFFTLWLASFCCFGGEPVVIGQTISIESKILTKKATLDIRLPDSYKALKHKRYPVLFSLGSFSATSATVQQLTHNQEYPMPEVIVVALTTETAVRFIERGVKNDDFFNFFTTDVIPYIDKHYRTHPFRILTGGERFGAVPLYGLTHKPTFFQAYIAISPWIKPSDNLISEFETVLKSAKSLNAYLWLSSGGEERVASNFKKLDDLLKHNRPKGLVYKSSQFNQLSNMSQSLVSLPYALESLFADLFLSTDTEVFASGAESIIEYYRQLSENKYGYPVSVERALRVLGISMYDQEKIAEAITIFKSNAKRYPDSPHVYANLAAAYKANKNLAAALLAQQKAVELAQQQNSAYTDYYRQLLEGMRSK